MKVTHCGVVYDCATAVKCEVNKFIKLYDANGVEIASFDNISDFSDYTISGGSFTAPGSCSLPIPLFVFNLGGKTYCALNVKDGERVELLTPDAMMYSEVLDGVDILSINNNGKYRVFNATNAPGSAVKGYLEVTNYGSSNNTTKYRKVVWTEMFDGLTYENVLNNGTWMGWNKITTENSEPTFCAIYTKYANNGIGIFYKNNDDTVDYGTAIIDRDVNNNDVELLLQGAYQKAYLKFKGIAYEIATKEDLINKVDNGGTVKHSVITVRKVDNNGSADIQKNHSESADYGLILRDNDADGDYLSLVLCAASQTARLRFTDGTYKNILSREDFTLSGTTLTLNWL